MLKRKTLYTRASALLTGTIAGLHEFSFYPGQ